MELLPDSPEWQAVKDCFGRGRHQMKPGMRPEEMQKLAKEDIQYCFHCKHHADCALEILMGCGQQQMMLLHALVQLTQNAVIAQNLPQDLKNGGLVIPRR